MKNYFAKSDVNDTFYILFLVIGLLQLHCRVGKLLKTRNREVIVFWYKMRIMAEMGIPIGNYMFKVKNRNTRTGCEICLKLTIKTPERLHWRRSGVFIVNFEHISHTLFYCFYC